MASNYIVKIQGAEEAQRQIHYEVDLAENPIGEGGMGRVYRGVQVQESTGVRREVAVKFLREDLPASMLERARREASIQIRHDNLVEMIGFVQVNQTDSYGKTIVRLHVVSELLRGVMLFDLLSNGKTTDIYGASVPYAQELLSMYEQNKVQFAVTIGKKILSGISQLHDAGYIHRDIDPSNIMITTDGKVKLIDFGIAREFNHVKMERQLTSVGNFLGKAAYAAPELVLGDLDHQNETTDVYAIGILLFQLCTGHLPFEGPVQDVMEMQRTKSLPLNDIEDKEFRKVIEKATAKSQSRRFHSASEFRVALDNLSKTSTNSSVLKGTGSEPGNPYESLGSSGTMIVDNDVKEGSILANPEGVHQGTSIIEGPAPVSNGGLSPDVAADQTSIWDRNIIWGVAAVLGLVIGSIIGCFV